MSAANSVRSSRAFGREESTYHPLLSARLSGETSSQSLDGAVQHYAIALEAGQSAYESINFSSASPSLALATAHLCKEDQLEREVAQQRKRVSKLESHLIELDKLWSSRRDDLLQVIAESRAELTRMESDLWMVQHPEEQSSAEDPSPLQWVDGTFFNLFCVGVILFNFLTMVLEATSSKPREEEWLWFSDQLCLCWYIIEICLRVLRRGSEFFIGYKKEVAWNWLDIFIVASGVAEQWLLPVLFAEASGHHHILGGLRILRLLRVMRMARILRAANRLWNSDLSWVEGNKFHMCIVAVIGLNALTFGLELDNPWSGWSWLENMFLVIYTLELVGRLKHHGRNFFFDKHERGWNILDLTIYIFGVTDQWLKPAMWLAWEEAVGAPARGSRLHEARAHLDRKAQMLKVFRLLRILRLARLLRAIKPLHKLMCGVLEALKSVFWVMVLTIITLYAFAILATSLVGHGLAYEDGDIPENAQGMFTDIPSSMFLLFKVMNDDQSVMDPLIKSGTIRLVFVIFMVTANWLILATLTAVVSENMINAARQQEEAESRHRRTLQHQASHARLTDIFIRLDTDKSGTIDELEFRELLQDPVLRDEICDSTGLGVDELYDLFDFLSVETESGAEINYQDFIRKLHMEGDLVHERSIFRIEKKVSAVSRKIDELIEKLPVQTGVKRIDSRRTPPVYSTSERPMLSERRESDRDLTRSPTLQQASSTTYLMPPTSSVASGLA
mmetsp:Transcript_68479/g.164444  ORF Transcript_68479/g.164444 Transcript_68479/m.164444 type:complete len:731 (+) Transcript_68479:86-2278(+)